MAANDLPLFPERSGAGQYLFCHFYNNSLIRQLSVTKDFNPGAQPLSYFSLTDELRKSVQYHLTQLNRNSYDPKHAVWGINTIYSLRGEHVFIAENLTAVPRPKSRRGQFANFWPAFMPLCSVGWVTEECNNCIQPNTRALWHHTLNVCFVLLVSDSMPHVDPVLLLHLAATPSDQYEVRSQLVVTDGFQPTDSPYPYFSTTKFWRRAIKAELERLNNHSEDLRDHAWALGSIHSITQGKPAEVVGCVLVLHWMSCEPVGTSVPTSHSPMLPSARPSPRQWVPSEPTGLSIHADHYNRTFREAERDLNQLTLPPYSL